nr:MAG: hypothetical protein [Caudoviricetes sp.]
MSHIKIFRIRSGEDLISFYEEKNDQITLIHPIVFFINYNYKKLTQELIVNFWLPMNVIEENRISLNKSEILFELTPKEDFKEYYLNFLNGFEKVTDTEIDKEQILSLLQSGDAKQSNKIH